MVESVKVESPQVESAENSESAQAQSAQQARQDWECLVAAMAARPECDAAPLFVMNLRVVSFLGGKGPLHMGCFVCRREPERHWQAAAVSLFEQVDMHCAAHAAAFHAVVRHRFICCAPPYDPARAYAWRREGRALLAQPAESESEPDDTHVPDPSEAFLRSVTSRNRAAGLAFLAREPPEWNDFLASAGDEQSGSLHRSQDSERREQ